MNTKERVHVVGEGARIDQAPRVDAQPTPPSAAINQISSGMRLHVLGAGAGLPIGQPEIAQAHSPKVRVVDEQQIKRAQAMLDE